MLFYECVRVCVCIIVVVVYVGKKCSFSSRNSKKKEAKIQVRQSNSLNFFGFFALITKNLECSVKKGSKKFVYLYIVSAYKCKIPIKIHKFIAIYNLNIYRERKICLCVSIIRAV